MADLFTKHCFAFLKKFYNINQINKIFHILSEITPELLFFKQVDTTRTILKFTSGQVNVSFQEERLLSRTFHKFIGRKLKANLIFKGSLFSTASMIQSFRTTFLERYWCLVINLEPQKICLEKFWYLSTTIKNSYGLLSSY